MNRHRFFGWAGVGALVVLVCLGGKGLAAGQEPAKPKATPVLPAHKEMTEAEAEAAVNKVFETYDLKPHALPAIPDNPPPHEGAMISYSPYVIEPPDLVLIEVLEALPGRPISGERLVRPDGKISLGFYGEVHVAGLTIEQAKVKIIKLLRKYLSEEGLGLFKMKEPDWETTPEEPGKLRAPVPPEPGRSPLKLDEEKNPIDKTKKPHTAPASYPRRSMSRGTQSVRRARVRLIARRQDQGEKKAVEAKKPVEIPLDAKGRVTVTIEVQGLEKKEEGAAAPAQEFPAYEVGSWPIEGIVDPKDTDRVFVDITAYNSKNYFVLGDVGAPGRLPCTGNETVLDALQFANGLLSTAEPKDIHLVRPARGGKPAHVYEVDLEAIQNRGDTTTNYQIFPGDRLVVGRNDVVEKTIQLDRLAAPLQTAISSILQESYMLRSLQFASPDHHGEILKNLVEFWVQALNQTGGVKLDENTLREGLMKRVK